MNKTISFLTVNETGEEHNGVYCPVCKNISRPHGLGRQLNDKIQLVRICRFCDKLFWYWINYDGALVPFGDI